MPRLPKIKPGFIILAILTILLAGLYLLRRKDYVLNRTVRLISWRILQHEQISRHRRDIYRLLFTEDHYTISSRVSGSSEDWKEIASYLYGNSLRPSHPGLIIEIEKGAISLIGEEGRPEPPVLPLVLELFRPQIPHGRRKGIVFRQDGSWRVQ
jgi:hypothetical protein